MIFCLILIRLRKFGAGGLSIFGDGTQDIVVAEVQGKRIKDANQELKRLPHIDTYAYRPHITLAYMPVGLGQVFINEVSGWGIGKLGYGTDINYGDWPIFGRVYNEKKTMKQTRY